MSVKVEVDLTDAENAGFLMLYEATSFSNFVRGRLAVELKTFEQRKVAFDSEVAKDAVKAAYTVASPAVQAQVDVLLGVVK